MKIHSPIFTILLAGVFGVAIGWFSETGVTSASGGSNQGQSAGAKPVRFCLTEAEWSSMPPTAHPPRARQGNSPPMDAEDHRARVTALLDNPATLAGLEGRLDLAEALAALAFADLRAAMVLAARLPPGDQSGDVLDHLAGSLLDRHGMAAVGMIEESANAATAGDLLRHFMAALAARDPAAAFRLGQEKNLFRETRATHLLFLAWGEKDPGAAADALQSLPHTHRRQEAALALAAGWARRDPRAALEWAGGLKPSMTRERCLAAAVEQYAALDPASALAYAANASPLQSAALLSSVLSAWARVSPSAAAAAAVRLPEGRGRDQALAVLGRSIARQDPDLAATLLDAIRPGPQAHAFAASMAADWAEIDAPATLEWIASLPESLRERAIEASLARLAGNAPGLAAEFALQATPTPALADHIAAIASSIARDNPDAALAWADQFESETTSTQIRQAALLDWSREDPVAALRAAAALESNDRDSLVTQVAGQWASKDPVAALAWAREQEGDLGLAARGKALEALVPRDPEAARREIESLFQAAMGDPKLENPIPHNEHPLTGSTSAMVRQLSLTDPRAATEWARSLPEGNIRREILSRQYTDWATMDPAAAVAYAESSLEGWDRDWTIVSALFRQTETAREMDKAMDLAPRIRDPGERARAVRLIKNSMAAPPDWRRQLLARGYSTAEIDNAGD